MKILVTGGCGFIGSNLVNSLANRGDEVHVIDDFSNGEYSFIQSCQIKELYETSIYNPDAVKSILSQKFDAVAHLAAMPRVSYSVKYPYDTTLTNLAGTINLLEKSVGNVRRFINTSSSSVYGNATVIPTIEEQTHQPVSPYALQKSQAEQWCEMISETHNLETVSIRPFNVYGPNQKGNSPYATAIASWLRAVKHKEFLRSDGDGEQARDVIYVSDVVSLIMAAIDAPTGSFEQHRAYNAGTGVSTSNNAILKWFRNQFPECVIQNAPFRPGDVGVTQANILRAKNELGWYPKVSLWHGLELTKNWVMNSDLV